MQECAVYRMFDFCWDAVTCWSLAGGFRVRSQLALSWQPHRPCIISPTGGSVCPSPKKRAIEWRRTWQTASLSDPPFPWRGNPGVIVSTKYGFDCLNPFFVRVCVCVLHASLSIYLQCLVFSSFVYRGRPTKFAQLFNHVDKVWIEDNLQSAVCVCVCVYSQDK